MVTAIHKLSAPVSQPASMTGHYAVEIANGPRPELLLAFLVSTDAPIAHKDLICYATFFDRAGQMVAAPGSSWGFSSNINRHFCYFPECERRLCKVQPLRLHGEMPHSVVIGVLRWRKDPVWKRLQLSRPLLAQTSGTDSFDAFRPLEKVWDQ